MTVVMSRHPGLRLESAVTSAVADMLRFSTTFRRLQPADRQRVAEVARAHRYAKGSTIFSEGEPSDFFMTIVTGRVKVYKATPAGKEVILEIFGPGDPLGATAAYEGRPFPATAVALEDTECLLIPRGGFFALLEQHPSLVRGLLTGLTQRLVELTTRIADLSGARVEARFARLFVKLAKDIGRPGEGGTFIPLTLSRQELADMTGTTIETCIRIMSRWGKEGIVRTDKDGFTILEPDALNLVAAS
jgi:CRP/FNR family transcriptional regulator